MSDSQVDQPGQELDRSVQPAAEFIQGPPTRAEVLRDLYQYLRLCRKRRAFDTKRVHAIAYGYNVLLNHLPDDTGGTLPLAAHATFSHPRLDRHAISIIDGFVAGFVARLPVASAKETVQD